MSRSRTQLATTYAPGVLFTWEGAKGICRSVPIERESPSISDATRLLIYDGIREIASNWFARANAIRPDIPMDLILDDAFYNPTTMQIDPQWHQDFHLSDPGVMGYVPYPLLYRCAVCGRIEEFESIEEQSRRPLSVNCSDHQSRWSQLDVVYVHWSGSVEPLSPYRNNYDQTRGQVNQIRSCQCGSQSFRLNNQSAVFADWRFSCDGCGSTRDLKQPDKRTWEELERIRQQNGRTYQHIEIDMLPVSYRANSAYYPQRSAFIVYNDRSVVELLLPQRRDGLAQRVAHIYGIPFSEPADADVEAALTAAGRSAEWRDYVDLRNFAERASSPQRAEQLRADAQRQRELWFSEGVVERGAIQSPALLRAVADRADNWARRFDPIKLAIEHDRFVAEHINLRAERHEAVDVLQPDRLLCEAVGNPVEEARYRETIGGLLEHLGVAQLVLIRGLPICDFSFGFTRVSATPVYQREYRGSATDMPVRLNAFPAMPNTKHPIYVTQQRNEALYFKLDEARVRRWLAANGVNDIPADDRDLGAAYIETYDDFGQFLEEFKRREGTGGRDRLLCAYTYLLLHSLSHQVMHALADASGLDRDGLGEYIFPADLSFVVYRKGMTPDLGNISAMWRNHAAEFLRRMLDPRLLRCGSGTLCDTRGGACPACIMVSEVTCIGSNQLLSRATLRGGPAPLWEPQDSVPLVGYFDPSLADG